MFRARPSLPKKNFSSTAAFRITSSITRALALIAVPARLSAMTPSMALPALHFIVTIDVEEDNWGFAYHNSTIENIRKIPRLQKLFDFYGIKPTYLVSYPVVSTSWAVDILAGILSQKKCEIGAHLHPWNTPPVTEVINERNSMLKNLPYELQTAKLTVLTEKIGAAFGRKPSSFRAGRWGLGSETIKALIACDYLTDCSVTPTVSWLCYGDGPAYPEAITEPYWLCLNGGVHETLCSILEVPATIGFNRWPFARYNQIHSRLQQQAWLRYFRPIGLMHHTGILRKIWLCPEISSADDMIILSKVMIANGMRFLNMSFHSTTLLPGKSPFVHNNRELEQFYRKIETVLDYIMSAADVMPLTLSEVRARTPIPLSRA